MYKFYKFQKFEIQNSNDRPSPLHVKRFSVDFYLLFQKKIKLFNLIKLFKATFQNVLSEENFTRNVTRNTYTVLYRIKFSSERKFWNIA